jgi:hypothetical protein
LIGGHEKKKKRRRRRRRKRRKRKKERRRKRGMERVMERNWEKQRAIEKEERGGSHLNATQWISGRGTQ